MAKANNFGLQTRDISKAGKFCLHNAAKNGLISDSSSRTYSERWQQFATFAKDQGVRRLEHITPDLVKSYGHQIADQVENKEISPSYGQNLIGSINRVMDLSSQGQWTSVKAVADCSIDTASRVRTTPPSGQDRQQVQRAAQAVSEQVNPRAGAVVELSRDLGLRSREASLIDARKAEQEARETGKVTLTYGTKGGRVRTVPTNERAKQTLTKAAEVQGSAKSLMDPDKDWKQWREQDLSQTRDMLKNYDISRLHDLRSAYACERYEKLTGSKAPINNNGKIEDKQADYTARLTISQELGHNRVEVTNAYLGGRR